MEEKMGKKFVMAKKIFFKLLLSQYVYSILRLVLRVL